MFRTMREMRVFFALGFLTAMWLPSQALAHPGQPGWNDPLAEIDAALTPTQLSPRAILAAELPRLMVTHAPKARNTIMDIPFLRALFKGVQVPAFLPEGPSQRVMMLAVRPRGTGGLLRFRVRFDSALAQSGPLRRYLWMRRVER